MKKIMILAVAMLATVAVKAQEKGNFEFGFGPGLNMSSISDSNYDSETSYSFNIAGSAEYYFSSSWGIKAKVIYDRKGWDRDYIVDQYGDAIPTDFNVNYLTVPVMANWHFGRTDNWYLNFGPYVGFLLSAEDTTLGTDVSDAFNSTDAGLALGIGVKIPLTDTLRLFIEYEGQGGMSDIFKENEDTRITNSKSAFNIGVNFML